MNDRPATIAAPTVRSVQEPSRGTSLSGIRRAILAALGVLMVVVAGVGAFMPGIPTVGPLVMATFLFARSHPKLEERFIKIPLFAKFLPYVYGQRAMTRREKATCIALMWTSIMASGAVLYWSGAAAWAIPILAVAGLIGTIVIARLGSSLSNSIGNSHSKSL